MADVSSAVSAAAIQTFSQKELEAITTAARQLGVKVAAHAHTWRADLLPENGGVDTLEHGNDMPDELVADIAKSRIIWVPTLSVFYTMDATSGGRGGLWDKAARNFQRALERGVDRIACGGDTGPFPHGDNALELKLMVRLGAGWPRVLRWATLGGWTAVRSAAWDGTAGAQRLARVAELSEAAAAVGDNEVPFGAVQRGFAADIIATAGDLERDFQAAVDKDSIVFVMKGGRIVKRGGRSLL